MARSKHRHAAYHHGDVALGWRGRVAVADYLDPDTGCRKRVRLGDLPERDAKAAIDRFPWVSRQT